MVNKACAARTATKRVPCALERARSGGRPRGGPSRRRRGRAPRRSPCGGRRPLGRRRRRSPRSQAESTRAQVPATASPRWSRARRLDRLDEPGRCEAGRPCGRDARAGSLGGTCRRALRQPPISLARRGRAPRRAGLRSRGHRARDRCAARASATSAAAAPARARRTRRLRARAFAERRGSHDGNRPLSLPVARPLATERASTSTGVRDRCSVQLLRRVARRELKLSLRRLTCRELAAALELCVELGADQNGEVRQPQPDEEDDHGSEPAVGLVVEPKLAT